VNLIEFINSTEIRYDLFDKRQSNLCTYNQF